MHACYGSAETYPCTNDPRNDNTDRICCHILTFLNATTTYKEKDCDFVSQLKSVPQTMSLSKHWVVWYGILMVWHIVFLLPRPSHWRDGIHSSYMCDEICMYFQVSRVRLVLYFANWSYSIFHMIRIQKTRHSHLQLLPHQSLCITGTMIGNYDVVLIIAAAT